MIKILVLGHNGMLGSMVYSYFSNKTDVYEVLTLNSRWGDENFKKDISNSKVDFIVNCIGAIPQKHKDNPAIYQTLNIDLPLFLDSLGVKVIHPSTDCEFSGELRAGELYTKKSFRDAQDPYGKSKAYVSKQLEDNSINTKIIRVSIIGPEKASNVSFLNWVLSSNGSVNGYTDHYWNGITTLEWSHICESLVRDWDSYAVLNQFGTFPVVTKYEMVKKVCGVFGHDLEIFPVETGKIVNKCMESDRRLKTLDEQLIELKNIIKHE
jgi:dTDP-4-dehydrorhamnose reductase